MSDSNFQLLTVGDVARMLKVSEPSVRNMVRRGEIPHVRLGQRTIRFVPAVLEAWLDRFFEIGGNDYDTKNAAGAQCLDIPDAHRLKDVVEIHGASQSQARRKGSFATPKAGSVAESSARKFADILIGGDGKGRSGRG